MSTNIPTEAARRRGQAASALRKLLGDKKPSIEELVKPVIEDFPYGYTELYQKVSDYIDVLAKYDQACADEFANDPMGDTVGLNVVALRGELETAEISFTIRYPDLGRVSGWSDTLPDKIVAVSVSPESITRYVGRRTLFEFIGQTNTAQYTITVLDDGGAKLEVDNFRL